MAPLLFTRGAQPFVSLRQLWRDPPVDEEGILRLDSRHVMKDQARVNGPWLLALHPCDQRTHCWLRECGWQPDSSAARAMLYSPIRSLRRNDPRENAQMQFQHAYCRGWGRVG